MRKIYDFISGLTILFFTSASLSAQAPVTQTFVFTGNMQTFTVPVCVSTISVDARGAQGGGISGALGGNGGRAMATLTVVPLEVLEVWVGGAGIYTTQISAGGFNGGAGHTNLYPTVTLGGTGGGGSDIRRGSGFSNRIIAAGGGGGGSNSAGQNRVGGAGGGLTGGTGGVWNSWPLCGGQGGTQSAGGAAGVACCQTPFPGTFGVGGAGAGDGAAGGGGGGGWYGGGGGLFGGGGGGSSWVTYAGNTNTSTTSGFQSGDGLIIITYNTNGSGVTASASPSAICAGQNLQLNASGLVSYSWSTGATTGTTVVSPSSSQSYTIQGVNSSGCSLTAVVPVIVNTQAPVLSITSTTNNVCPSTTVMLTASGALAYSWTGGITNAVSFTPVTTSTYVVTGTNGCGSGTAAIVVSVTPLPVTAMATPTLICATKPATLSAGGAASFTWQPGNLPGTSIIVGPSVPTVYTVTGVTGACSGSATFALAVDPNPTITVPAPSMTMCAGSTVTLSASGGVSYTWNPGNIVAASPTVSPAVSTPYTVIGENGFGCTAQSSQVVLVSAAPIINVSTNKPLVCAGGTSTLFASGASSYLWSAGSQFSTQVVNPLISTVYTVTGSLSTGCSASKTIAVNVFIPVLTVSPSSTICVGSIITLTASQIGTWVNGGFSSINTVTPSVATVYSVSANTTSNGVTCSCSNTISVDLYQLPVVLASTTRTSICKGEKVILTATGASTYAWNTSATSSTIQVSPSSQTSYTVTGTDLNGCQNTGTITLKTNPCTNIESFVSDNSSLVFYPNPNAGTFVIRHSSVLRIEIFNETGQLVRNIVPAGNDEITVKDLIPGIYLISAETEGRIFRAKVFITN